MNIYSLTDLCTAYFQNKDLISRYLNLTSEYIEEGYIDSRKEVKILGMGIAFFLLITITVISLWIWAIYVLFKYWNKLTPPAQLIAIAGIVPFVPIGPWITLAIVYGTKKK